MIMKISVVSTCGKVTDTANNYFVLLSTFSSTLNVIIPIRKPRTKHMVRFLVFARKFDKLNGIKAKNCSSSSIHSPLTTSHCKNDNNACSNHNTTAVTI